jgi:triosephosphate isomerase (TIM)
LNGTQNTGEAKLMGRKKIVAGNWKMNLTQQEAFELAEGIKNGAANAACEVILIPSFVFLNTVQQSLNGSDIKTGAQNCAAYENGAYTGEVSAAQLKSAEIDYVIVGHSERREYFGDTNAKLKTKLQLALKHGIKPIFCFGEPLHIRQANTESEFVKQQLEESLFGFSETEVGQMVLAYEPIWAIGTGLTASAEQAQQMHAFVRGLLAQKYGQALASGIRILYGGSVKPGNAKELFSCNDVDGGLIGGASLMAKDFLLIIEAAA